MRPDYDLDEPLTLIEACAYFGNRFKPATLRAARRDEKLVVERLGNKDFVTIREINNWRARCRGKGRVQGCISGQREEIETDGSATIRDGSSETDRVRLALDAAMLTVKRLSASSPTTSPENINRPETADVIPLPSRSPTS